MNLTNEQITRLNTLTEQTQSRFREDLNRLANLPQDQRFDRWNEFQTRYWTDWSRGASDIFQANQAERFHQLQLQYGGFNSWISPEAQRRLQLTAEQQRNLRAQIDWSNEQINNINRLGTTDRERALTMYRDYQGQLQTRMNQFLTAEQQRAWQQMIGDPYKFQPPLGTPHR